MLYGAPLVANDALPPEVMQVDFCTLVQRRLSAAICSARISNLASTSTEARLARALLHTERFAILPDHNVAAVTAVLTRVCSALTPHIRVILIASKTAQSSWASALDSTVRAAAKDTHHVSNFTSGRLASLTSHDFTPTTVIAAGTVTFADGSI